MKSSNEILVKTSNIEHRTSNIEWKAQWRVRYRIVTEECLDWLESLAGLFVFLSLCVKFLILLTVLFGAIAP